jgi:hypothetical protein
MLLVPVDEHSRKLVAPSKRVAGISHTDQLPTPMVLKAKKGSPSHVSVTERLVAVLGPSITTLTAYSGFKRM